VLGHDDYLTFHEINRLELRLRETAHQVVLHGYVTIALMGRTFSICFGNNQGIAEFHGIQV
jgi:hypothetical protein